MLEELLDRDITHTFTFILYLQHCFWNTGSRASKPWEAILCRRIPPSLLLARYRERSQSSEVTVHCLWTPSCVYYRPLCDNGSWRCGDMERDTSQDRARSVWHRTWFSWLGILGSMLGWVSSARCYCNTGRRGCLSGAVLVTFSSSYVLYITKLFTVEFWIKSFASYWSICVVMHLISFSHVVCSSAVSISGNITAAIIRLYVLNGP